MFYYVRFKLNKIYPIIMVCFVILILTALLPNINESIKARYVKAYEDAKKVISYVVSKDSSSYSSVARIRIWKKAIDTFKKSPVLGAGFGISYPDKVTGINFVHPHNIVLELLAETGILGFSVFAVLFGLIFKRAFSIYKQLTPSNRMTFIFYPVSLIFFLLYSSLHTDLSTEYFKWYFAGMITGFYVEGNGFARRAD